MVECNIVNVKLSHSQINKLNSAVKNQTGVILRMNIKIFDGNYLINCYWQQGKKKKKKQKNAFENNILTDIKLSKTQMSKIIQSGGF